MYKIAWLVEQYLTWKNNENDETKNSITIKKLMILFHTLFSGSFIISLNKNNYRKLNLLNKAMKSEILFTQQKT